MTKSHHPVTKARRFLGLLELDLPNHICVGRRFRLEGRGIRVPRRLRSVVRLRLRLRQFEFSHLVKRCPWPRLGRCVVHDLNQSVNNDILNQSMMAFRTCFVASLPPDALEELICRCLTLERRSGCSLGRGKYCLASFAVKERQLAVPDVRVCITFLLPIGHRPVRFVFFCILLYPSASVYGAHGQAFFAARWPFQTISSFISTPLGAFLLNGGKAGGENARLCMCRS